MEYTEYIAKSILHPLKLHETTFETPNSAVAAKAGSGSDWGHDEATNNP